MSFVLIATLIVFAAYLFSEFGGRLAAKNSLMWWLSLLFLIVIAAWPELLIPVAEIMGIKVISNLILAALVIFLYFQAIQENVLSTQQSRKLRQMVSAAASKEYLAKIASKLQAPKPSVATKPRVLVVFPAYNEQETLPGLIQKLQNLESVMSSSGASDFEMFFCIVDDGSMDQTPQILTERFWGSSVSHLVNVGVAGVLLTGFRIAKTGGFDYCVQCDADGQHPVERIPELIRKAVLEKTDLLIGSRFVGLGTKDRLNHRSSSGLRQLGSLLILSVLRMFRTGKRVTDPTSGFRVYSKKACSLLVQAMPDEYPEPESIALLALKGAQIGEIPVEMSARQGGVSSLTGLKGPIYILKVVSALLGLRLRSLRNFR